MLSSSSPAQKNLDKEESSGSDAGSEVGLEPETDRFGFIVTKGCTAGRVGPPPELVRQREAKWINIIVQWDHILLKKTSKVKVQSQKGIPASLRAKCWPLLCGATDMMKQNKNLYQYLDSQPALQSWVDVIERDLDRQFPFHEMFLSKDGHGQRGLFRVLKAFTQYQPDEGYCQAQGPVAAVLLMNMPAEEAFWCLVQISEHYLPGYYSPLLEGVLFDAAMLTWVLKKTCPAAYKHLQRHDVEPLMFATDWLMCLFTRHLPFNTLLRVWDLFFCYGVRVLLQVVVVLVCRVLGRAEQRKRCQGQMETLEKLRGVREQVQEEEDSFIAEVCSVPLSDRDLEKQMEKELEKWRKSRPSSTFNPRGRCQGFQMAWERARQKEEDQDRKERVKGNLSIPLARSASALSLSPYVIQTRWRKGGKVSAHEWEAGDRVVRRLSIGSKEFWRSSTESNFKKVQGVQEDKVSEEHKNQTEPKLGGQTDHKEPKQTDKVQNIPTEQGEETVTVKEQTEQVETRITEKEESQLKETEENKVLSEQIEERNVEAEPPRGSSKDQTVGNICQPTEHTTHHQQGAELNPYNQSQVLEQQSQKGDENEVSNQNEERVKQEVESEPSPAGKETQTETQKYALVDTNTVQQMQMGTDVSATSETSQGSETDGKVEAPTVREPTEEIQTQQTQQKVIIETDRGSQGDAFEGEHHRPESLSETDMEEESHTKTATEIEVEVEAEIVQMDSEAETLILCSPECIQPKEGTDLVADVQTEAKIPVSNDTTRESSEAITQCSEAKYDAVASEATYDKEESFLTVNSEAQNDLTQAEETPTQTQMNEETSNSIAPPQKELTSPQGEEVNSTPGPDGKTSSVEMNTSEERAPEQPKIQATVGAVEGEGSTAPFQERTIGDDIFISTEPSDSNTDRNPQVQDRESHLVKDKIVPSNNSLSQASVHHCSRSSRDICIRKSSSHCGPRIGRRLSEDLFTMPQKTSKSQSIPNKPVAKHTESQSNTGTVNPPQTNPDSTQSSEITLSLSEEVPKSTEVQPGSSDPLKRFGLFRRVRGDQPKKTKAKGALKMQVPKILIQDFSDGTEREKPFVEEVEEKLSSRERRRQRRDGERREKEEERVRKKREKELEKVKERERKRLQTRGKSFQVQNEKGSGDEPHPAKTASQTHRYSASHADSYF